MIRLFCVILLFVFFSNSVKSQDNIVINNEYMFDNRFILSPAWAGYSDAFQLRLTYYQQWAGISDAPSSQIVSLNGMVWNNSGFGINVYRNVSAFYSKIRGEFSYAYHLDFGGLDNKILSFGISGTYSQNTLDETKFTQSIVDPNVYRIMYTSSYPNLNLGLAYIYNDFYTSIKYDNMIPKSVNDNYSLVEPRISSNIIVLAGYKYTYSDKFHIEPYTFVNYVFSHKFIYWDINSKFVYRRYNKKNIENYWLGLSFRNNIMIDNLQLSVLNFSTIFGIRYDNYTLGIGYMYGFAHISRLSNGSFTFSFGYDFLHWYRRKLCNCKTDKYNYN